MKKYFVFILIFIAMLPFGVLFAQENEETTIVRGRVVEVVEEGSGVGLGTFEETELQILQVKLLSGDEKGDIVRVMNDYVSVEAGDKVFVVEAIFDNELSRSVVEIDRSGSVIWLLILFVVMVLVFSGKQGFRSLMSLAGSLFVIFYLLVPGLLAGYSPLLVSVGLSVLILVAAVFFTHGFNKRSLVAFLGTVLSVVITGVIAWLAVSGTQLSGLGTEDAVYLNYNTLGKLNMTGILLSGIIIGVLGVLDDIAITQVAVVRELLGANREIGKWEVYKRALRVGREHVSALVNTLVLAYTGAALPLLLLVKSIETDFSLLVNQEMFVAEIIRTLVGSMGLIITVPLTTFLAVVMMFKYRGVKDDSPAVACHHHHH